MAGIWARVGAAPVSGAVRSQLPLMSLHQICAKAAPNLCQTAAAAMGASEGWEALCSGLVG